MLDLPAAVGPDNTHKIARQVDGGGVDEGLETGKPDFAESHEPLSVGWVDRYRRPPTAAVRGLV